MRLDLKTIPAQRVADPVAYLTQQLATQPTAYRYLLAHALDGVLWGRVGEGGQLQLAPTPALRPPTLLEVRLFGPQAELYLWRVADQWQTRTLTDPTTGPVFEHYDEEVLLWGTEAEKAENGFTLVREANLGLQHWQPLPFAGRRAARLRLRHYLNYDAQGAAYVALSRLVDVFNQPAAK